MKKYFLALCVIVLIFVVTASALAFTLSLQALHVNAESLMRSAVSPIYAAPMTLDDESSIGLSGAENIRFQDSTPRRSLCEKNKGAAQETGF